MIDLAHLLKHLTANNRSSLLHAYPPALGTQFQPSGSSGSPTNRLSRWPPPVPHRNLSLQLHPGVKQGSSGQTPALSNRVGTWKATTRTCILGSLFTFSFWIVSKCGGEDDGGARRNARHEMPSREMVRSWAMGYRPIDCPHAISLGWGHLPIFGSWEYRAPEI